MAQAERGRKDRGHLGSPARRAFVSVEGCEEIEDARRGDEASTVVAGSARNVGAGAFEPASQAVEYAGAKICEKTEGGECIVRAVCEDVAPLKEADGSQTGDRGEDYERAHPAAEEEVSSAGDEPRGNGDGE